IMQMCTSHTGLNTYLTCFGTVDSGLCQSCCEPETVNHYLFTCRQFTAQCDVLRHALYADKRQPLNKKTPLNKPKNKMLLLVYVPTVECFPRYMPAPP
ncbi:hypothetical protein DFH07DRAFT_726154, partial [Mycena maculata]